jgi:hypothetical protein
MSGLASLSLDLFLLGHAHLAAGEAGDGFGLERRIRSHLDLLGLPHPGGFRVFGRRTLSGLYHQLDEQTACQEALVVGEWKAYRGYIPKNDLLRFKAATDDYWLLGTTRTGLPVVRIFGGTGKVTEGMRTFAAHSGIILITPDRWPVPALCDSELLWSPGDLEVPGSGDRRTMASLVRPLGHVLCPQADGSWRIPPLARPADLAARFSVWHHWSEGAWAWWDEARSGRFEQLLNERAIEVVAA